MHVPVYESTTLVGCDFIVRVRGSEQIYISSIKNCNSLGLREFNVLYYSKG